MKKFFISIVFLLMTINFVSFNSIITSGTGQKPEIKVYLLAGQSNMCGAGNIFNLPSDLLFPETEVLAYYDGQIAYPQYARMMKKLNGHLGIGFGPELMFGLDMEKAFPEDRIALIKWAYGATSLYDDWNPAKTDSCYTKFKDTVIAQMAALSQEYTPVIAGMLWMQGESDALYQNQADAYELNLKNFISTVKAEFDCPDLKFVIGRISDSTAWTYRDTVRKAQDKIAKTVANTKMIDTDDLTRWDLFHYDNEGLYILGHRFAAAMKELVTGIVSSQPSSASPQSSVSSAPSASSPASSKSSASSAVSKQSSSITSSYASSTESSIQSSSIEQKSMTDESGSDDSVIASKPADAASSMISATGSKPLKGKTGGTVILIIAVMAALSAGGVIYFTRRHK